MITETFVLRDDKAECQDCDWSMDQPDFSRRLARGHAKSVGHQVVLRRVQFVRYTGDAPALGAKAIQDRLDAAERAALGKEPNP